MYEKEIINPEGSFFLFKIYSKADNIDFSIKNLLASFNLKLFVGLKNLKVLINPIKRNNPFFIESPQKNIDKYLWEIFKAEKIFFESVNFRDNLLKIFHCSWKIPKFLKLKDYIYQSKKSKKFFWKFKTLFLDYVIISKITENTKVLSRDKGLIDFYKKAGKKSKFIKDQKKIRIDQLTNNFEIISHIGDLEKFKHQKHGKMLKEEFESSFSSKKNSINDQKEEIFIERLTKKKFMIISKTNKKALVLSLENEKLMIDLKKLKTKFDKIYYEEILASKELDKDGQILRPGNYCKILVGNHQNLEGKVIFLSDGKLFGKFMSNSRGDLNLFTIPSNKVSLLENSEHKKKGPFLNGEQFIKIREGEFKGYTCKVLSVYKNIFEVLIISTSKIIKILESEVIIISPETDLKLKNGS